MPVCNIELKWVLAKLLLFFLLSSWREESFNTSFGEAVQVSGFGRCRTYRVAGFQHTGSANKIPSSHSFLVWAFLEKKKKVNGSSLSFPPSLKSMKTTIPRTWVFHCYQIPWSDGVMSWNWLILIHCKTGSNSFHFLTCFCPRTEDDQETSYYSKFPLKIECFPNLE